MMFKQSREDNCKHRFEKTISYLDDTKSTVLSVTYFCNECGMMKTERFSIPCDHKFDTYISLIAEDWDDKTIIIKICDKCGESFETIVDGHVDPQYYHTLAPELTKPTPPPTQLITEGAKPRKYQRKA